MKKFSFFDSVLGQILSDLDLIMLEAHHFGIDDCLKTMTCTHYCLNMALEKGFRVCDRHQAVSLVAKLKSRFGFIGVRAFSLKLPRYIIVVEEVSDKAYLRTTIYFKRKYFFFIRVSMDHGEVVSSFLFDRKFIFKRPQ